MESYLQTAWGDQWDNVTIDIVTFAIKGLLEMDDEHGVFWVSLYKDNENILGIHKNLEMYGVFEDNTEKEYRKKLDNWTTVELLFRQFLDGKIEMVKARLEENSY